MPGGGRSTGTPGRRDDWARRDLDTGWPADPPTGRRPYSRSIGAGERARPAVVSRPTRPYRPAGTVSASRRRMYRRRRRTVALAALLVLGVLLLVNQLGRGGPAPTAGAPQPGGRAPTAVPTASAAASGAAQAPVLRPEEPAASRTPAGTTGRTAAPGGNRPAPTAARGSGEFSYATGAGPALGMGGPLHRFRVAVETGTGQDPQRFAAAVERILGDPRSWIGSGKLRLQRVPATAAANFAILLATPATSERLCATGGMRTAGYTSCRLPGRVVINLARWQQAIPHYGAPLATYQAYAINHEVGHQLGRGHESCPGKGRPAPVMQQQTYGLKGCVANPWPYVNGKLYAGPPAS